MTINGWDHDELDCPEVESNLIGDDSMDYDRWLMCDFHVHTTYSDGSMKLEEVIDLYGKLGFDAIAITDHTLDTYSSNLPRCIIPSNWIKNKREYYSYYNHIINEARRAKREYGMLVIPGIEFTNYISNIHVVGIDLHEYIEVKPRMDETLIIAKSKHVLTIGAHPWDKKFFKIGGGLWTNKAVSQYIDVWEAGNGTDFFPHVVESTYRYIGNTDFHGSNKYHGIKGWKTLVYSQKNIEAIKTAILRNQTALHNYQG